MVTMIHCDVCNEPYETHSTSIDTIFRKDVCQECFDGAFNNKEGQAKKEAPPLNHIKIYRKPPTDEEENVAIHNIEQHGLTPSITNVCEELNTSRPSLGSKRYARLVGKFNNKDNDQPRWLYVGKDVCPQIKSEIIISICKSCYQLGKSGVIQFANEQKVDCRCPRK